MAAIALLHRCTQAGRPKLHGIACIACIARQPCNDATRTARFDGGQIRLARGGVRGRVEPAAAPPIPAGGRCAAHLGIAARPRRAALGWPVAAPSGRRSARPFAPSTIHRLGESVPAVTSRNRWRTCFGVAVPLRADAAGGRMRMPPDVGRDSPVFHRRGKVTCAPRSSCWPSTAYRIQPHSGQEGEISSQCELLYKNTGWKRRNACTSV